MMSSQSQEIEKGEEIEHDWRADFIADYLLPRLPSPEWHNDSTISEMELEKSKKRLAEAYVGVVHPGLTGPIYILLFMLAFDTIWNINPISYGLAVSIWASVVMVVPSFRSPSVIASASAGDVEVSRRLHCDEMAYNNVGFGLLAFGFVLQIFGLHTDSNIVETALLSNETSSLVTTIAIFLSVVSPIYIPKKIRRGILVVLFISLVYLNFW